MKKKIALPLRKAEFNVRFGEGVDDIGKMIYLGVANRVTEKSGAGLVVNGERIEQGCEPVCEWRRAHPEVAQALRRKRLSNEGQRRQILAAANLAELPRNRWH